MTATTTATRKPATINRHSYYMKMVYCYFLATTTSSMRRMAGSSSTSTGFLVEAFVAPKRTIHLATRQNEYIPSSATSSNNYEEKKSFFSSSPATALSLSSVPQPATKTSSKQIIPRPQKVQPTASALLADNPPPLLNLHTIKLDELQELVVSWGYPKFRGKQIYDWIREKGVTNPNDMKNVPKALRQTIVQFTTRDTGDDASPRDVDAGGGALSLAFEAISKDGTRKRAYELRDGQLIESVLMGPYEDGRYTACISSQAGCAMGCVFCATGQMGFARQLSSDEIFEQVSRFASELKRENDASKRLSNIVFMGMGEPLANYRNVVDAVNRINLELGIGARKITVSTVGVVPSIKKMYSENTEMPQVRLAVSLHCANDDERTQLLPANARYGGLTELMTTLKEYIDTTGRRVTLEWALISHQNDGIDTARQLGNLIRKYKLRRDMIHVNVIPLNPTDGFEGAKPSNPQRVNAFCNCLKNDFGITATPRVRRGIDIDAGCGQLKAKVQKKEDQKKRKLLEEQGGTKEVELSDFTPEQNPSPMIGVYDDVDEDDEEEIIDSVEPKLSQPKLRQVVEFTLADNAVDFEFDEFENPEYEADSHDMTEALRLVSLVEQGAFEMPITTPPATTKGDETEDDDDKPIKGPTTSIVDEDAVRQAKKKRKKLLRNLKQIKKLKELQSSGEVGGLSREQLDKIAKEEQWRNEVEDLEHNLKS
jgi:23S rRNA (adenine2503-C2)-methyltransferase